MDIVDDDAEEAVVVGPSLSAERDKNVPEPPEEGSMPQRPF